MAAIPPVLYTQSDGVHVAYQVFGEGGLDLVLVQGFASHLDAARVADIARADVGAAPARRSCRQLARLGMDGGADPGGAARRVVGSTERAASLGDRRWTELFDAHDGAVRRELVAFRGREIKTTGDGFLATFDGPARGVRCARAIRSAATDLHIDVRVGLHAGEIEHRGDDIGGLAVHLCQRVMAAAQPAEIVVSSTVKDLVARSGIEFEDRGEHDLKGVPGKWRVFAVTN